jgi:hypothetical protein
MVIERSAQRPRYPDKDETGARATDRKLRTKCHDRAATVPIAPGRATTRVSDHVFIP